MNDPTPLPETGDRPLTWWRDRVMWWAVLLGLWLRILPLARWSAVGCLRDECGYLKLSERIVEGQGITPVAAGWLWAPGYPYVLAAHERLLGDAWLALVTQVLLTPVLLALGWTLGRRLAGLTAGRVAALLLALSPTLVFFAGRLWSEAIYTPLLLGALLTLDTARERGPRRAALAGALVGACVLFRGVATYMLPVFVIGLLWERWRDRRAWASVGALMLGATLVVAPWSTYASARWGGLVLSDRTLGQMMWLGNNEFPPITFDYGAGPVTSTAYDRVVAQGRPHCAKEDDPIAWDACEVAAGKAWIRDNPEAFLRRVPLRLAQLFNPNSFITREIRLGRWSDLRPAVADGIAALTVLWSGVAVLGGVTGLLARMRGALGVVSMGVLLYHVAAISLLAGLSRYRVPLDAIGLIWAAALFARPRESVHTLVGDPRRFLVWLALCCLLVPLMLHFLPGGFRP